MSRAEPEAGHVIKLRGSSAFLKKTRSADEEPRERSRSRNMAGVTAQAPSQEPEILLAQRLAANEKLVRTKALKTLRKYFNLRSQKEAGGFTNEDLMKIWKGLFYCLWMQDKPLLQEELSDRISGLIHSFHTTDSQLLYFETFLQTLKREWNGIDRLRMDKFFQLVRFVFRQAFEVLRRRQWDSSLVNQLLEVFTAQLLQSTTRVPDGLMLHILELYMTELARVGAAELTAEQNLTFIDPFCRAMAKTKERSVLTYISKNIFSTIVDHASYAVEDLLKELRDGGEDSDSGQASEEEEEDEPKTGRKFNDAEDGDEGSEDELLDLDDVDPEEKQRDDYDGHVLQFDYEALADRLFELGSRTNTPNFNRAKMYRLVKIEYDVRAVSPAVCTGVFPQDEEVDAVLRKKDCAPNKKNKKNRRNKTEMDEEDSPPRKRKACTEVQEAAPSESAGVRKKRKRKQKPETSAETDTQPVGVAPPETPAADGQSESPDNGPDSQHKLEPSARKKKKQKGKKLESQLKEDELTDQSHTDSDEVTKHAGPDSLDSGAQPTTAPPSGRTKSGKQGKRCSDCVVPHVEDLGASAPVKKKKKQQRSAMVEGDIERLEEKTDDASSSSVVETSLPEPEGVISKKKKKQKMKKTAEEEHQADTIKPPEESPAPNQTTTIAEPEEQRSDVSASTMKKKNKKQKPKEIITETNQGREPEVASEEPTNEDQAPEAKSQKKKKKKVKQMKSSEEKEAEAEAACTTPTPVKKKTQKKEAALVDLTGDENEESLSAGASEEPVQKKRSKKKQKAEAETSGPPNPQLKKGKKKRSTETQEAETSQVNGHAVEEDPEISTSVTPKKKLKMKSSSTSTFASFQGQAKAPSPLFCRVRPKGSTSSPLSNIKVSFDSLQEFHTACQKCLIYSSCECLAVQRRARERLALSHRERDSLSHRAEFRKTDRSLLVSPVGSSRVAFDPKKRPVSGVLKSPASSPSISVRKNPTKRPTAADFF
ncbi:hypothetical protein NFI96_000654 [Prochilodus magdalenae]|nr:hypothetical protein NFI96_000654 [Prochilodus magdalenae]